MCQGQTCVIEGVKNTYSGDLYTEHLNNGLLLVHYSDVRKMAAIQMPGNVFYSSHDLKEDNSVRSPFDQQTIQ